MTKYIKYDCGCKFSLSNSYWNCEELCDKHRDEICGESK